MTKTREINLTDGQLLDQAREGVNAARNALDALAAPWLPEEFRTALVIEADEALVAAHAAALGLRCRAVGFKPPKVGD